MPPEAYIGETWFLKERNLLFTPLWQFVAPKALLSKHNTFVRRRLSGKDVIVQNINGNIKAFENVCAHRQSPIQLQNHGVRPLICPYHAWSYGEDGRLLNIPNLEEAYRFTAKECEGISLKSYSVYEFGQLIFINMNDVPLGFWDQFDEVSLKSLKEASALFDSEVLVASMRKKFNWKLAYENLRDSQHPQFVHTKTLFKNVKFQSHIDEEKLQQSKKYAEFGSKNVDEHLVQLKSFSYGGPDEPINGFSEYQWHQYVERYGCKNWYYNWLMYPNLHIASSTGGYSFIIEHHNPISPYETEIWIYYLTGMKKRPYPTSAAVLTSHMAGAEKVLAEDFAIMEGIQSNITMSSPKSKIGDYDYLNMSIEKWYLDTINSNYDV
jgi:phenylpropionate dioxygenase-like ring-hydroxylating dioxygenase large terminal subunit